MSFNWNLSSDEEEDFEGWGASSKTNRKEPASIVTPPPFARALDTAAIQNNTPTEESSSNDDDDSVDWEDAGENGEDAKPAAKAKKGTTGLPQAVQIDLSKRQENSAEKKPARKRKRRNKFRVQSLPRDLQDFLWNLNRSHLLSLTSSAVFVSEQCSTDEVLALAHSLVPIRYAMQKEMIADGSFLAPTVAELQQFLRWYFNLVHDVTFRRRQQEQRNRAAGAPSRARSRKQQPEHNVVPSTCLQSYAAFLSSAHDEDPQLVEHQQAFDDKVKVELLLAMTRSLGWRVRLVKHTDPVRPDLDVNHPLLQMTLATNLYSFLAKQSSKKRKEDPTVVPDVVALAQSTLPAPEPATSKAGWIEVLCSDLSDSKSKHRWVHIDPIHKLVDKPNQVELLLHDSPEQSNKIRKRKNGARRSVVSHVVAVEHSPSLFGEQRFRLTDVTPRYAESWVHSLRKRGVLRTKSCSIDDAYHNSWWFNTVKTINQHNKQKIRDESQQSGATKEEAIVLESEVEEEDADQEAIAERDEIEELKAAGDNEAMPTSKKAFQTHPLYVIPSVLGKSEVLAPGANFCGVFKGQFVYRRSDVSTARTAKKWRYEGRSVLSKELGKPIKKIKARKQAAPKTFKALKTYGVGKSNDGSDEQRLRETTLEEDNDGMDKLYAKWQTQPWSPPPIGPQDDIPVNEYKNIELALLNPGLAHIDQRGMAKVAKNLGIPYAPCLLGFEGHGGNRTPTVRGIVVHDHNALLIREAGAEVAGHSLQQEHEDRRKRTLLLWKKLMVGLVTQDRLEREYGNGDERNQDRAEGETKQSD